MTSKGWSWVGPYFSLQVYLLCLPLPLLPRTLASPNLFGAEHPSLLIYPHLLPSLFPLIRMFSPPFGPTVNTPHLSRPNLSQGSLDPQDGMTTSSLEPQLNPTEPVETPTVTLIKLYLQVFIGQPPLPTIYSYGQEKLTCFLSSSASRYIQGPK